MSSMNKRLSVISQFVEKKPGLGKTAMMKYLFLLQEVYGAPLDYDFEIYTYGPYSSEVMEDIDYAKHHEIINMNICYYPNACGYELKPASQADVYIKKEEEFISTQQEYIDKIIELFGNKTAKELELSTTIIYLHKVYKRNGWDNATEQITTNVHEIKPHFSLSEIEHEYSQLDKIGLLNAAS